MILRIGVLSTQVLSIEMMRNSSLISLKRLANWTDNYVLDNARACVLAERCIGHRLIQSRHIIRQAPWRRTLEIVEIFIVSDICVAAAKSRARRTGSHCCLG